MKHANHWETLTSVWMRAAIPIACIALAIVIVMNAWVTDDAFITFREIDNFLHGYGLRWNTYERVQVYTHPLWMLLLIPFYAVWHDIFLIAIFLGLICTLAAVVITLRTFSRPPHIALCCFLLPLALSKSFIDFATSGLENSLSYLLFAVFGFIVVRRNNHPYFWFYLSFVVALALLNRLDMAVFYLPVLCWLAYSRWKEIRWRQVTTGILPLVSWFVFSLFYYGFLFPNTKYAKLNTGIEALAYIKQGLLYFLALFNMDTLSFMFLCSAVVMAMKYRNSDPAKYPQKTLFLSINLSVITYMGYVIAVGGDFMSGRFWAVPFFAIVWLIYVSVPDISSKRAVVFIICLAALKYFSFSMAEDSKNSCTDKWGDQLPVFCPLSGIGDEKFFYTPYNLLFDGHNFSSTHWRDHYFVIHSAHIVEVVKAKNSADSVIIFGTIGMAGYNIGPGIRIIDWYALADPLLARLPVKDKNNWRIGHFERAMPEGYVHAVRTGDMSEMSPELAAYYRPLRLIVSGDLWDIERLKTIVKFNLGYYDHYKQAYLDSLK